VTPRLSQETQTLNIPFALFLTKDTTFQESTETSALCSHISSRQEKPLFSLNNYHDSYSLMSTLLNKLAYIYSIVQRLAKSKLNFTQDP
jgi:hypothetical protein